MRALDPLAQVARPTRAGIVTGLVAAGCVLAAWLLGSVELAGAGVVTLGLLGLGFARVVLTRPVTVRRRLAQSRVARGQPLSAQLEVSPAAGPLVALGTVEDPVGERGVARVALGRRRATRVTYPLPTDRRGPVRVGPARVTITDPFGLWRRHTPGPEAAELLVLPGIAAIDPSPSWTRRQGRSEGRRTGPLGVPGDEFHAVRPWEDGDDIRHVHWPSVARTGELMVRQHEPAGTGRLVLELDTVVAHPTGPDAGGGAGPVEAVFEQMVTLTASLLVATTRAGDTVDLVVGSEPVHGVITGPRLDHTLDRLAMLEPRPPGTGSAPRSPLPDRRIRITGSGSRSRPGPRGEASPPALVITVEPAHTDLAPRGGRGPVVSVPPDRDPAVALAGLRSGVVPPRLGATP